MTLELTALNAEKHLRGYASTDRKSSNERFFKTGKGQYGEGDIFLGVTMPDARKVAKVFLQLPITETEKLLKSPFHEVRMLGLLIFVAQFQNGNEQVQKAIYDLYLSQIGKAINNWDLVDVTAEHIVGAWLWKKKRNVLYELAKSRNIWERRVAIIATFHFIKQKDCADTFKIADILMSDKEDLIHKATGWMLREVGKRCGEAELEAFLEKRASTMPRTMLRYAIERFEEEKRLRFLKM